MGERMKLGKDGEVLVLWGDEVEAWVPLQGVGWEGEGEPAVVGVDKERAYPPKSDVAYWLGWLRKAKGEMGGYVMRREREKGVEWGCLLPKQKATGGNWVAVDATEPIQELWEEGWEVMGDIHTHPGSGGKRAPSPSGEDVRRWEKDAGVHLIGWRKGRGVVSVSLSLGGYVFREVETWRLGNMRMGTGLVWLERGLSVEELIVKPEPVVIQPSRRVGGIATEEEWWKGMPVGVMDWGMQGSLYPEWEREEGMLGRLDKALGLLRRGGRVEEAIGVLERMRREIWNG